MKTYTTEELKQILIEHGKWLRDEGGARANLESANLEFANLRFANLASANLRFANLRSANLRFANLRFANLESANLRSANLPAPTMILLANWGLLLAFSTIELMRLDASAHPDKGAFCGWAEGGPCPYNNVKVQRIVNFDEKKELWSPGPPPTIWDAMKMILDEKCPGWDE